MAHIVKKPNELIEGDIFQDPESEEEHHGLVPTPEVREKYWIFEIQPYGMSTAVLARRERDGVFKEVIISPWVSILVIENRPLPPDPVG
jgi:hypothetical protein